MCGWVCWKEEGEKEKKRWRVEEENIIKKVRECAGGRAREGQRESFVCVCAISAHSSSASFPPISLSIWTYLGLEK